MNDFGCVVVVGCLHTPSQFNCSALFCRSLQENMSALQTQLDKMTASKKEFESRLGYVVHYGVVRLCLSALSISRRSFTHAPTDVNITTYRAVQQQGDSASRMTAQLQTDLAASTSLCRYEKHKPHMPDTPSF